MLIVEDEPLLSMLLEDMLEELGHGSPQICATIGSALEALESQSFDGVFVDLNLHSERADPVVADLKEKGIPFVITTGGIEDTVGLGALALVSKPYRFTDIEQAVGKFLL